MAIAGVGFIIMVLVVCFVVSDLMRAVDGEGPNVLASVGAGRLNGEWKDVFSSCRNFIVNAIPLTAVKIVVVVWQIVTQVYSIFSLSETLESVTVWWFQGTLEVLRALTTCAKSFDYNIFFIVAILYFVFSLHRWWKWCSLPFYSGTLALLYSTCSVKFTGSIKKSPPRTVCCVKMVSTM